MRKALILILLIIPALVCAQGMQPVGGVTAAAAAAPTAAYYYSFGLTENDYTSSQNEMLGYYAGAPVAVQAGTATKLRVKLRDAGSAQSYYVCLYSGTNTLVTGCGGTTSNDSTARWYECTISQAVTAQTYRVAMSLSSATLFQYYNSGQNGVYATQSYTGSCAASPTFSTDTGFGHAVGIYVEP